MSDKQGELNVHSLQRARLIMDLIEHLKGLEFTSDEARILIAGIQSRTGV